MSLPLLKVRADNDPEPHWFRPYHNLYAAFLTRALMDIGISLDSDAVGKVDRQHTIQAWRWIRDESHSFLSFNWTCECLNICPVYMRVMIKDQLKELDRARSGEGN
jgi:hypothetical protein